MIGSTCDYNASVHFNILMIFQDKLHEIYRPRRDAIRTASSVSICDLLAATTDLLMVDKVNSEKERKRTATRLNKVSVLMKI